MKRWSGKIRRAEVLEVSMLIFKESKAVMTVGIYVMDDTDPEVYMAKKRVCLRL